MLQIFRRATRSGTRTSGSLVDPQENRKAFVGGKESPKESKNRRRHCRALGTPMKAWESSSPTEVVVTATVDIPHPLMVAVLLIPMGGIVPCAMLSEAYRMAWTTRNRLVGCIVKGRRRLGREYPEAFVRRRGHRLSMRSRAVVQYLHGCGIRV